VKIFAHNFSGYDSHLIIEKINHPKIKSVSAIPKSGEKFMAVTINDFLHYVIQCFSLRVH